MDPAAPLSLPLHRRIAEFWRDAWLVGTGERSAWAWRFEADIQVRPRPWWWRHFFPAMLALLLAAGPAAAREAPIVVFGDSLAVGVAAQLRAAGRPVVDLGIVGWGMMRRDWQARVAAAARAARGARGVVVWVGANDRGASADAYRARLEALRGAIPGGVPVVWIAQPEFCGRGNAGMVAIDAATAQVAAAAGDRIVTPPPCAAGGRARDGVHLTPAGYRAVAGRAARWLP